VVLFNNGGWFGRLAAIVLYIIAQFLGRVKRATTINMLKPQNNLDSQKRPQKSLEKAIFDLHGCKSKWIESVPTKETFKGQTVWEGVVQVFDLIDHPTAKRCYAWSYVVDDTGKRKFFAVLHQGPVDSPQNAVKAAIVGEHKNTI